MLPWGTELAGRLDRETIDSALLRDNPLGDPHERPLWVYVPPGYDESRRAATRRVYVIQGYTGHVGMWANRTPFRQPFLETADAVFARGEAPRLRRRVRRRVDGVRRLAVRRLARHRPLPLLPVRRGGAVGRRPLPDDRRPRARGRSAASRRGGFGAMITPMLRPDLFGALATHAGDTLYELCYLPEFAQGGRGCCATTTTTSSGGGPTSGRRTRSPRSATISLLMMLGCSAAFSAAPGRHAASCRSTRAPGVLRPDVWQRWLDWDPVRMVDRYADALRSLRAIWIDAGTRDEWFLDLGAAGVPRRAGRIGVPDERVYFELFDGRPRRHRLPIPAGARLARTSPGALRSVRGSGSTGAPCGSRPIPSG